MGEKIKNIIVVALFMTFVFSISLANLIINDKDVSVSERRKLAQFSSLNYNNFTKDFEDYALDQFVGRDWFRKIKSYVTYNVYNQKDNNKIYIVDNQVSKYNDFLDEGSVKSAAKKYNTLYDKLLSGMNVYYSIIPDKNYFIAKENGYPSIDYEKFMSIMKDNVKKELKYIDLFDEVTINDYYSTDIHWKQENLQKVVDKLLSNMKNSTTTEYNYNKLEGFYGNYYGQAALPMDSESLIYCTNDVIDSANVYMLNEETFEMEKADMYDIKAYNGIDPYDIFLSGPKPLIVIENTKTTTDRELLVFRDSFGSSLAPLLLEGYKKVTVVDLRYIGSPLLPQLIEFKEGQDVLIINYVDVLNNSSILKVF